MPHESYHVRVTKDYLVFSAAHFITYNGNICERLHGHNYRVAAELYGPLDENQYVIDFIRLRDALKDIVDRLDHRVLLPTKHHMIKVVEHDGEVTATFEDRRWVFPRQDCVLLPVANTTAEQLACHIAQSLVKQLDAYFAAQPFRLVIEVDENNGQVGVYTLSHDAE